MYIPKKDVKKMAQFSQAHILFSVCTEATSECSAENILLGQPGDSEYKWFPFLKYSHVRSNSNESESLMVTAPSSISMSRFIRSMNFSILQIYG